MASSLPVFAPQTNRNQHGEPQRHRRATSSQTKEFILGGQATVSRSKAPGFRSANLSPTARQLPKRQRFLQLLVWPVVPVTIIGVPSCSASQLFRAPASAPRKKWSFSADFRPRSRSGHLPIASSSESRAKEWYERRPAGLGLDIARTVEAALSEAAMHPALCRQVGRRCRRTLLRRFPYTLVFMIHEGVFVEVACFHQHRDPKTLRDRVRTEA